MLRHCYTCSKIIDPIDHIVDAEHNMFNLIGVAFAGPVVCNKCWIEFQKNRLKKET